MSQNASTKELDQDLMPAPAEGGGRAGSVCSAQVSLEESQEKRKAAREGLPVTPPPPSPSAARQSGDIRAVKSHDSLHTLPSSQEAVTCKTVHSLALTGAVFVIICYCFGS